MDLSYSLGKEISGEKILKEIIKLCKKIPREELSSTALVISLVKITDLEQNSVMPNIEYKPNQ